MTSKPFVLERTFDAPRRQVWDRAFGNLDAHLKTMRWGVASTRRMGLLTFSINVTLEGCVDHQQGIADDETHDFFTRPGAT